MRLRRDDPEHREQCELFNWARKLEGRHPQLGLMFAIPNGGLRNKIVAAKLKKEGVKAGVLDIFLPVPRLYSGEDPVHGLFIEMKVKPNKPTKNQLYWMGRLEAEGYETAVCYSWIEAKDKIINYLKLEAK